MKVVFVSNYLNHHQLPFCEAMIKYTNGCYFFVATMPTPENRLQIGYHDMNDKYSFVICAYENEAYKRKAIETINSADSVIAGSAPEEYIRDRIEQGKIVFRYSERLYKQGYVYLFAPKRRKRLRDEHLVYEDKPVYMLCASSYTSGDFALNGLYKSKCFKWGYFPEVKEQNMEELMKLKQLSNTISILWAGRLIRWKHPDISILVAEKLMKEGYNFSLTIVGSGEMETQLREMISQKGLTKQIKMTGSLSPEEVRLQMEKSEIFLFTSDYQEGWGAVLNESMNSGCAVIASDAIGSAGFLIKDGVNGSIYKNGNVNNLFSKMKELFDNRAQIVQMGKEAYSSMMNLWNADVAAKRFLALSDALQNGTSIWFEDGPCSVAEKRYGGKLYIGNRGRK